MKYRVRKTPGDMASTVEEIEADYAVVRDGHLFLQRSRANSSYPTPVKVYAPRAWMTVEEVS